MRPIISTVTSSNTSALFRLDDWAPPNATIQVTVSGTINYTVNQSLDDPNDPTNPVALGSMTWTPIASSQTANSLNTLSAPARFIQLLYNSGTGSATATVLQSSAVTF